MARYHISPHTGDPGVCSAKINCPYGNLETDHFDTPEAARAAYETGQLEPAFATLRRALDKVTDTAFESAGDNPLPSTEYLRSRLAEAREREDEILAQAEAAGYDREAFLAGGGSGRIHPGLPVYMAMTREDLRTEHEQLTKTASASDSDFTPLKRLLADEYRDSARELSALTGAALDLRAREDQAILDGAAKAGLPVFDPNKGPEPFDTSADYHINGSDEPALTDEAMDEMGAHLDAADKKFRTVRVRDNGDYNDDNEWANRYEVEVSDFGRFETDDYGITVAAKRVADAGEWGELETWDEDPEVKLRYVARYLRKPNALDYIADGRLDNTDAMTALGDADDLGTSSKRFRIQLDNALLDIAEKTLRSEADAKTAEATDNKSDEPPF